MTDEVTGEIEKRSDDKRPIHFWRREIELADKEGKEWRGRAREIVSRYEDKSPSAYDNKFNILYSNTETLKGALFGRMPQPDVRRRNANRNDVLAREAAISLERAISYAMDIYDSETPLAEGLWDALVPGRGVVRAIYEPQLVERMSEPVLDELGEVIAEGEPFEDIGDQSFTWEYVYWRDFLYSPARTWADVRWVGFRHYFTRDELIERFGDVGREVKLDWQPSEDKTEAETPDVFKRAIVWEVWDKDRRQRVWVAPNHKDVLQEEDDPYSLEGFFPLPQPLMLNRTTDSLEPLPLYTMYQDQADELDRTTGRLNKLIEALKYNGVYDGSVTELADLANSSDNTFIAVNNFASLRDKGGLKNAVEARDILPISQVVANLVQHRELAKQNIYEITGIGDIMRAQSDPRETFGAQKLKGKFGSMRLRKMQAAFQNWVKGLIRVKAELIAEHVTPENLMAMTGKQYQPEQAMQIIQLLRNDKLRGYSIDIETDSTVFEDAEEEKQSRMEFLQVFVPFMERVAAAPDPIMQNLAYETLHFGMRAFKVSRNLEEAVDQARELAQQKAQQPQQQQPNPEVMKAQMEMQIAQAKMQNDMQMQQAKAQAELQMKRETAQIEARIDAERMLREAQQAMQKLQIEATLKNKQIDQQAEADIRKMQFEARTRLAELQQEAQLERENMALEAQLEARNQDKQTSLKERKLGGSV